MSAAKRGRPPAPIRSEPYAIAMLLLVSRNVGKPCPTREEIMDACGVCRNRVPEFLENLVDRGLIEIETKDQGWARRMRVQLGEWTAWTHRPGVRYPEAGLDEIAPGGLPRARKSYGKQIPRKMSRGG